MQQFLINYTEVDRIGKELESKLPSKLSGLLGRRDGAACLASELSKEFSPEDISKKGGKQRTWEVCGIFYLKQGRFFEAIPIFSMLYNHMIAFQEKTGKHIHKGMPLVWLSDCYHYMGYRVLAKRYLMLTLCEDAIKTEGKIDPESTGVYFRLVWSYGLSDTDFRMYAKKAYELFKKEYDEALFPEWTLQELGHDWMTEPPSPGEIMIYPANLSYISHLMKGLGDKTGKVLERLADYMLSVMPGCRVYRRKRSGSTDYDLICSVHGLEVDFRSELGRYFLCECKDWNVPAGVPVVLKFCMVLQSTKCRFGILFSKGGISGTGGTKNAERELLKIYQGFDMVIVVIDEDDLNQMAKGASFTKMLRTKYEKVRLDLI